MLPVNEMDYYIGYIMIMMESLTIDDPCLGCRIEKLWVQNGTTFFFGPIFIHPEETEHEPTKMFYKREVFLSNLEETLPMTCFIGTAFILLVNQNIHHVLKLHFYPAVFLIYATEFESQILLIMVVN